MQPTDPVEGRVGALPRRVAGALAYCTVIPAVFFLLFEPYKEDEFVRFHAFQSILLLMASIGIAAVLWIVGSLLGLISVLPLLFLSMLVGVAAVVIWMVLVVKALQGEMFKLPLAGDFADRHADAK
jgi:uncharacterized membrane protein